ncbi:hypothetical protein [Lysobacter enzymogenes]|uniref:hypothetical protein n=1 Tax=Lysobacter enzymogenes TaxID=69 RepID=UPI001A976B91|nr:hypothetical protein [Lysobacter enzymogenes]QQP95240.1 hypothetical protein JHW38_18655 [Lysobacter enzymogenes]
MSAPARRDGVARGASVAVAAAWIAGSAYVAWDLHVPGVWGIPLAVAAACAGCLILALWPQALAARGLRVCLWIALFCFAVVPPVYTLIADAFNAWDPNRFMCGDGDRLVRCRMIGMEVFVVPLVVFAAAVAWRLKWRDDAIETAATALALLIALIWLTAVSL